MRHDERWQHGSFYGLAIAYAVLATVALIQLIRISRRCPQYGWTTQKVFHLLNLLVCLFRALVMAFHLQLEVRPLALRWQARKTGPLLKTDEFESRGCVCRQQSTWCSSCCSMTARACFSSPHTPCSCSSGRRSISRHAAKRRRGCNLPSSMPMCPCTPSRLAS